MSAYLEQLLCDYLPPRLPYLLPSGPAGGGRNRGGLCTLAIENDALLPEVTAQLMKFAFVHYAKVGFINAQAAADRRWQHEPLDVLKSDDKHLLVLDSASGELCAYATLKAAVDSGRRVADSDRQWLSVERAFGRDILATIPALQNAPIERVREVGRVTRSAYLGKRDPRYTRASAELLLACMRQLIDPCTGVDWIAGDGEPDIMIRNVCFLGAAPIVIRGVRGQLPAQHLYQPRYVGRDVLPFAFAIEHIDRERLDAVDAALEQPDASWSRARDELRNGRHQMRTAASL